jgi:hypothetical protein
MGGAFGSLHVVLDSFGAESDPFGLAHQGELDVNAVEEIGMQESDVGFACCDCGQHGSVLANEGDVVDSEGRIKQRAGPNEYREDAFAQNAVQM